MSQFQRMMVIPQDEYLTMSAVQNVRQPMTQHFYNLERQFNEEEKIHDPYKRLIHQSSTLDEMKQMKERMRNSLSVATPKPYQNRAQALFKSIESFLRFNERGEIMDENDKVISQSRLEDLINHAVRDRRRSMTPTGWPTFLKVLHDHNIPKSILNRNTLDELDGRTTPPITIKKEVHSPSSVGPKPSKLRPRRILPQRKAKANLAFLKTFNSS